ncbi:MAG: hypothetical protein EXX96DRAFT_652643, partial [Benjaminiella poitrasii]
MKNMLTLHAFVLFAVRAYIKQGIVLFLQEIKTVALYSIHSYLYPNPSISTHLFIIYIYIYI